MMNGTAGKKVVDVAFKAGKTIDWEGMAKLLVSDEARKEFATLRRAFDEEPEPIDWEYYRKGIGSGLVDMYKEAYDSSPLIQQYYGMPLDFVRGSPSRPSHTLEMSLIAVIFYECKCDYCAVIFSDGNGKTVCVEVPKYVDTVTPQYKPKFEALLVELKEAEGTSLKESERLEKEIAEVQELKKKISTMTADEYFEKHPEVKKKFDDEIRNDYWGY
ncbi:hypothetical protein RHSIM_Rhsim13G0092300 [Rhododendron simsii]|uniref:ATP synthase subunit d, mitochondrial n=1 Tax=Rhododendron simsii TaxID=118357 RepID=A0A834L7L1_RHOSS|nr:hypothetical protein RHSIM_Rhsim13G0092300 [Rhododendron simsii]